jgi:predicted neuraminidase
MFASQSEHVHSSSVVECPNGDLIAVWYQGSGERSANDVKLNGARLRAGERTWGPVFPMADTPHLPDCNPVLFIDAKKRLWLFWIVIQANQWERSVLKYRRAEQYAANGAPVWSWQDVILLTPGDDFQEALREGFDSLTLPDEGWAEYARPYSKLLVEAAGDPGKRQTGWMPRARPLELPTGRILLPLYSDGFNVGLMAISDDGGDSWQPGLPIVGAAAIQPTLARRSNGDLVAYCRDNGGPPKRVLESVSHDQGQTWSVAVDSNLPNPGSSIAAISLADGRWALIYNDTESGRARLAAALSEDEGNSWPHKRYLERDEVSAPGEAEFSYPTAIQSRDGRIHVTYSQSLSSGATIKHASFAPDWILESDK